MTTPPAVREALRRPVTASLLLLLVYAALSLSTDPGGYLGTDTGAKVATLDHMAENDTQRPLVGYWAEEWDPDGEYHPLVFTKKTQDGDWTNVTTLPMLQAGRPLYEFGGYRLALLLPMLGAVAAALACRDIARQIGDDGSGWRAFWIVGLASPIAVYALDFWEHAPGAGLMLWAWAALLRVADGDDRVRLPLLAGAAFGASASMRTETFVVGFVAVASVCVLLSLRRRVLAAVRVGLLSVVGFAGPWFANALLESELGGRSRGDRASGAVSRSFWNDLAERAEEAAITWFSLPGLGYPDGVLAGAVVVVLLLGAAVLVQRNEPRIANLLLVAVSVVYVLVLAGAGLSFVPGALVAAPVAVAAFWFRPADARQTLLLVAALASTVLIWLYQYLGGAGPQWGGRYILVPTLLLVSLGAVRLGQVPRPLARTVTCLAVGVTAFGVAWLGVRSHEVDEAFDTLVDRPEDVVISTNGFLVREGGPSYDDRRFLSLSPDADLSGAVDIVRDAGLDTFAVLTDAAELSDVEATEVEIEPFDFLGVTLWYHRYEFS